MGGFIIPMWLKILGPIVAIAIVVGGIMAYGKSKYNSGHDAGVTETDAKWQTASDQLKKDAAASATKADDRAIARLEEHVEQAEEDQEKVDAANQNGTSPLDALFGG